MPRNCNEVKIANVEFFAVLQMLSSQSVPLGMATSTPAAAALMESFPLIWQLLRPKPAPCHYEENKKVFKGKHTVFKN